MKRPGEGFTLAELLVVVVILALAAGLLVSAWAQRVKETVKRSVRAGTSATGWP
jgi:prepilin-type N-terminal cleavage/methylation domain-containing protein